MFCPALAKTIGSNYGVTASLLPYVHSRSAKGILNRREVHTHWDPGTTLASAMAMGSSPWSPIMVTSSTSLSKRSASTVSARVSNSVPCWRIFVSTSMKVARVCRSLW